MLPFFTAAHKDEPVASPGNALRHILPFMVPELEKALFCLCQSMASFQCRSLCVPCVSALHTCSVELLKHWVPPGAPSKAGQGEPIHCFPWNLYMCKGRASLTFQFKPNWNLMIKKQNILLSEPLGQALNWNRRNEEFQAHKICDFNEHLTVSL